MKKLYLIIALIISIILLLGLPLTVPQESKDPSGLGLDNCKKWNDGCNICEVFKDDMIACTERACFTLNEPYCIETF